jgi:ATP/maltotriose-dependent transcriptional regulator MalT
VGNAAVASGRWPLVGRHEDLESITDAVLHGGAGAVLLYGPAGVGKTRLADEALDVARRNGREVGRVSAGAGAEGLSLGALIPLLPVEVVDVRFDPVALFATVTDAFRARAGDTPYVLFVDDLHRLDAASSTLLGQLVDAGAILLLATVRSGETVEGAASELWRRDHVLRIDLDNLRDESVDTLLHLALGGPVEAATVTAIATASRGNVLFVRELVLGARAAGRLVEHQGVWRLTGPLLATDRLAEVVDARLGALTDDAADLLATLALLAPLGLAELETRFGADQVASLDTAGLLDLRTDRRREEVSLAHPLYAEVVRDRLSPLQHRRVLRAHADHVAALGARRREDPLRLATARLDAQGAADPDLLLVAARLARYGHAHRDVVRLARAALTARPVPEAVLLLAESLHELGAYADAEDALVEHEAIFATSDEAVHLQLVEIRVRNLFWGLQRLDDALAVNRAARAQFTSPAVLEELVVDEAMALALTGRPVEALDVLAHASTSAPRAHVLRSMVEAPALMLTGRCDAAAAVARDAFRDHEALGDQVAVAHPAIHMIHLMLALLDAGAFAGASRLAERAYAVAVNVGAPAGRVWWAYGIGRAALLTGRLDIARRWLAEAAALSHDHSFGQCRLALSLLASCHAQLGDAAAARAAVDDLDSLPRFAYRAGEQELGRAWALVAEGNAQGARSVLRDAADEMHASGQFAQEAWLLHEIARLGDAASVAARLDEIAPACEGALVAAYALHARAAAARTAHRLAAVVEQFRALDASLFAAEAANEAADAYRRDGDGRAATAMVATTRALVDECPGATTPALLVIDDVPDPLTAREREIATLAARRLTGKEIAQQLHVSVRTVDNHLQRIYVKLGITGRAQLAGALGLAG